MVIYLTKISVFCVPLSWLLLVLHAPLWRFCLKPWNHSRPWIKTYETKLDSIWISIRKSLLDKFHYRTNNITKATTQKPFDFKRLSVTLWSLIPYSSPRHLSPFYCALGGLSTVMQIEPLNIRSKSITSGVFIEVTFSSFTWKWKLNSCLKIVYGTKIIN